MSSSKAAKWQRGCGGGSVWSAEDLQQLTQKEKNIFGKKRKYLSQNKRKLFVWSTDLLQLTQKEKNICCKKRKIFVVKHTVAKQKKTICLVCRPAAVDAKRKQ